MAHSSYLRVTLAVGLTLSLLATTVFWLPAVAGTLLPADILWRNLASQAVDWTVALVLIALVIFGEKKPLGSMGFRPVSTGTAFGALGLAGFFLVGVLVWQLVVSPIFPPLAVSGGSATTGELPAHFYYWFAPLALVTASVAEEVIYRGYAMERLLRYCRNPAYGLILPHTAFALMHLKDGVESAAMIFVLGGLLTWFYYSSRDLTLLILAHFVIDAMAVLGQVVF